MIKLMIFVGFVAAWVAAVENSSPHSDDWNDHGERPPNCTCADPAANNTEFLEIWKYMREDWIIANLHGNETLDSLYERSKKHQQFCGTDGKTFANYCEFVNRAAVDSHLGARCYGECPCDHKSTDDTDAGIPDDDHRRERAICLNNNVTVHGWEEVKSAIRNSTDVGVRCLGECARCAEHLRCPRRHHRRPQSNETAPNCNCTMPKCKSWRHFLDSTCGERFIKMRQVCGTDNVTYDSLCDLKNNQSTKADLGLRCRGACPCHHRRENESLFGRFDDGGHGGHGHSCRRQNPFMKYWTQGKEFCLNNGRTIRGLRRVSMAMRHNSTLGIRCEGDCAQCTDGHLRCPVNWFKMFEERRKHRPHAPNCTCPNRSIAIMGHHVREVCGNDGETYDSLCDVFNHQANKKDLGVRCFGRCPCRDWEEVHGAVDSEITPGDVAQNTKPVSDNVDEILRAKPRAPVDDESDEANRIKRETGRPDDHHRMTFCLTNGHEVDSMWMLRKALKKHRDLGVRCLGNCSDCADTTECPRFWRKDDSDAEEPVSENRANQQYSRFPRAIDEFDGAHFENDDNKERNRDRKECGRQMLRALEHCDFKE